MPFADGRCLLTLSLELAAGSRRNPQPGWLRYVAHTASVRVGAASRCPGSTGKTAAYGQGQETPGGQRPGIFRWHPRRITGYFCTRASECHPAVTEMNAEGETVPGETVNHALADASIVACPHCDLLQRLPEIAPGASARCPRCDKELWRRQKDSVNRTLPLTLAALVLYVIANTVPMLGLTAAGHHAFTTVVGGAQQLWNSGQQIVAVLVLFAAVIAPALQIGFMLLILIGCQRERPPAWVGALLRHLPMT